MLLNLKQTICYQILQQKFDDFLRDLHASEDRVTQINTMASNLISERHPESEAIKNKRDEINHMWSSVKEVSQARQDV